MLDWYAFLQRQPLPAASMENLAELRQRPVLVTGAAGSIGSGVVSRLAHAGVELILLDSSEAGLYELQPSLPSWGSHTSYLGNVADRELLAEIFARHRPATVIHTAAFKHVPMLEEQPLSAIANNVVGTAALADAAVEHGARILLLSTDKAVAPRSVMGATKHVAEKIVLASNGVVVRLANVLGSRGSVSEVFAQQIAAGRPLTVTDSAAERYFLTLAEAVELLVSAASSPDRASIIIPLLTRAHRIADLASFMAKALAPERNIAIEFTGLRIGEKMSEQLWADDEIANGDPASGIVRIAAATTARRSIHHQLQSVKDSLKTRDVKAALHSLTELVPAYEPSPAVLALANTSAVLHG